MCVILWEKKRKKKHEPFVGSCSSRNYSGFRLDSKKPVVEQMRQSLGGETRTEMIHLHCGLPGPTPTFLNDTGTSALNTIIKCIPPARLWQRERKSHLWCRERKIFQRELGGWHLRRVFLLLRWWKLCCSSSQVSAADVQTLSCDKGSCSNNRWMLFRVE